MKQGHFHVRIKAVSRTKGYSAVAAAAYQSGQNLTHEKQRQFSVDLGYEKEKGYVTTDYRKKLNKGIVSETLREEFAANGVTLGEQVTARKDGRRDWTIIDGDKVYTVREFEHKELNAETRKRETKALFLDVYADKTHNYTTREDVKATWVQAPDYAPGWIREIEKMGGAVEKKGRESLWNWAEAAEIARDARTARTFQLSINRKLLSYDENGEVSYEQSKALLRQYVEEQLTPLGFISDIAIHSKKASDGKENVHAHVLVSTRRLNENGTLATNKAAPWDEPERIADRHKAWGMQIKAWRGAWAEKQNAALGAIGSDTRVDHRSYKEQGVDVIPKKHATRADLDKEKRGEKTALTELNEAIERVNKKRDSVFDRMADRMRVRRPRQAEKAEEKPTHKPVEGRAERPAEKEHYAARITVRRWFGLGGTTVRTFYPGPASLPRKKRDALERTTPRLTPGELHERLAEHQARSFGGYIISNQSGGSPPEAVERLQRMANTVREKAAEARQHIGVHYKSWRDRVSSQRKIQHERSDKNDRER